MAEKVEKERLDVLLVQQGLANSRELAKAYIMAGNVYVDGQKEDKAGTKVAVTAKLEVKGNQMKYVSRGGYKLVARFFGYSPLMGPFIAVFAAYLWGTDYEYGTLRNKLICGHTREEVYFSNLLLTICAGLSTALIWLIVNGMLGIPLLGTASLNLSLGEMAFYIFSSLLMVVALSSVCCLLASLAENKNSATLLCLGAVAAMVIIGMLLYDRFAEPELLDGWMWSDTDPTVRWHPQNIKFIGGTFRILLEFLICLTPGGQGVILCEEGVEHLIFLPLCSAFVIFSTSLIGSRSFKKKNLK